MRIIISPAKKMKVDTDSLPWRDLPVFLSKTEQLADFMREMSYEELKNLWKCNDSIATLNAERLSNMDLHNQLTPALLAYEGIQYQYMAPGVFTRQELEYVQEHLRILSGFYGILKPFDGVTPYRLEMQAKLGNTKSKSLYIFWDSTIAKHIFSETNCIVNLASKEYSICVSQYLPKDIHFITCVFGELKNEKIIEKGTLCKMARGEMVRYMAENQITDPAQIKAFDRLGYRFDATRSNKNEYIFLTDTP